jgi:enoyl-[acyl-carrier protein] reductase III
MINLAGQTALVTGGSRGIGRAIALKLAEAGADVVINFVSSREAALQTAEQVFRLGRRAYVVKADVREEDDIASMMEFVKQEAGGLSILVSNAASGGFRPLLESTATQFIAAMSINTLAMIRLVQAALPMLENSHVRGKVVGLSSHGSHRALPMYGLIGSSKAALESVARHLTLEVGHRNTNVNIVLSGLVETDSTRNLPHAEQMFAGRRRCSMMGDRDLQAEDVANAVLFLASPLSDLVQGETLTVDGGAGIHVGG